MEVYCRDPLSLLNGVPSWHVCLGYVQDIQVSVLRVLGHSEPETRGPLSRKSCWMSQSTEIEAVNP